MHGQQIIKPNVRLGFRKFWCLLVVKTWIGPWSWWRRSVFKDFDASKKKLC